MNENELGDLYREGVGDSGAESASCPAPEKLQELVARTGSESDRMQTLDHVMSCDRCRREFELLRSIATAAREDTPSRRIPFALAASITGLVAAGAMWQMANRAEPVMRGEQDSVRVVEPVGTVDDISVVRWTGVGDEAQFELVISDRSGTPLYTTSTSDTVVVLPDDIDFPEEGGIVQIAVTTLTDGRVTLAPVEFRVRRQ